MNAWWYFLLTLVLEMPLAVYGYRKEWKAVFITCFLLNLFTWPLLHYFLLSTEWSLPLLEIGVLLVEMIGYRLIMRGSWLRAFLVSLAANGLSYGLGIIINTYLL